MISSSLDKRPFITSWKNGLRLGFWVSWELGARMWPPDPQPAPFALTLCSVPQQGVPHVGAPQPACICCPCCPLHRRLGDAQRQHGVYLRQQAESWEPGEGVGPGDGAQRLAPRTHHLWAVGGYLHCWPWGTLCQRSSRMPPSQSVASVDGTPGALHTRRAATEQTSVTQLPPNKFKGYCYNKYVFSLLAHVFSAK